jgi:hypothetical protein
LLVGLLSVNADLGLRRVADDHTLAIALERSQHLAGQLLQVLPQNGPHSPSARIKLMLDDIRRDSAQLRQTRNSAVFEAGVLFTYGDLCTLALEHLGPERVRFENIRNGSANELKALNGSNGKNGKLAFADTLFTLADLEAIAATARELLDALAKKEKLDSFQTVKWRKEISQLRNDLKNAQEQLRLPQQLSKIGPEARLLTIYAKAVSLTVN